MSPPRRVPVCTGALRAGLPVHRPARGQSGSVRLRYRVVRGRALEDGGGGCSGRRHRNAGRDRTAAHVNHQNGERKAAQYTLHSLAYNLKV